MAKSFDVMAIAIHEINKRNGWWDEPRNFGELIALCHSELSEALEAYRDREPNERILEELGDTVIRIFDMAAGLELGSIHEAIAAKLKKNAKRGYKHGGKKC